MKYKVKFIPYDRVIEVSGEVDLLKAAVKAGVNIFNSCGGKGICGRCKVKIKRGKYKTEGDLHLSQEEKREGYVLACRTYPLSDLEVEIPLSSRVEEMQVLKGRVFGVEDGVGERESLVDKEYPLEPLVRKHSLRIEAPSLENNLPDYERLLGCLEEVANRGDFRLSLKGLRELAPLLRESNWIVTVSVYRDEILKVERGDRSGLNYGLAMDIGTTTVVVHLVDLNTGKTISTKADYNKQVNFGEDVISRIIIAEDETGLEELNRAILDTLSELISACCQGRGIKEEDITSAVVSGNSTMLHLFLKVPPSNIRKAPYTPVFKSPLSYRADEIGLEILPEAIVELMPGIASFVGSDIVAGVLASGMDKAVKPSILIDLGTNGEVVLGNKDWMLCCSTSAGPCFEGGALSCGVRAMRGAIQDFNVRDEGVDFKTIGNGKPIGICGTGVIDIVAELLLNGIIDKAGNFVEGSSERIRQNKYGEYEFLIVEGRDTALGEDIVLTQSDIKTLLYSKAAIYLGMEVLLEKMELNFEDIDKIFIAGGLGTYLDIQKAIIIGLLPDIPKEKFVFLGNASIQGARLYLLSEKARRQARRVSDLITNIELSNSPTFMNNYTSCLFFPHTDLDKFPTVKNLLKK